jgi:glycine/D-amino acid oxidase-like deaminating enzyme
MHISVLPKDPRPSGWYEILAEPPPVRRLTGSQKADWVVVGAGFTGVAAARRLAELAPNSRIVLIEAQRAGMGASGRNSGFIIDVPHNADAAGDAGRRTGGCLRLNRFAIGWLQGTCREAPDPLRLAGRGQPPRGRDTAGVRGADPIVGVGNALALPQEVLSRDQIADRLGTSYYAKAVYQPGRSS